MVLSFFVFPLDREVKGERLVMSYFPDDGQIVQEACEDDALALLPKVKMIYEAGLPQTYEPRNQMLSVKRWPFVLIYQTLQCID